MNLEIPQTNRKSVEGQAERESSPIARVFMVRHGASGYKEYFGENPSEVTNDLTEAGEREIESASEKLAVLVDKNKPLRIISSPRLRTQNSAEIIRQKLLDDQTEIKPAEVKKSETFQGVKTFVDAAELWSELTEKYESLGKVVDIEWREGRTREDNRLESDIQIQERLKDAFIKGVRILRHSQKGSRDLSQTVLVTHGETISAILAAFNQRPFLDLERKIKTGSIATIDIFESRVRIEIDGFEYEINI